MISKEALEEFKRIWKKEFGTEISDSDALESATKLLNLMKIIYKPMTKKDYKKISERRHTTSLNNKSRSI